MGKMKGRLFEDMNVYEMQEYLNNYRSGQDTGYIEFLEEQLEKAEKKINNYKKLLKAEKGPGYCVECFKSLSFDETICSRCQDECDGRWDHLKEKEKGES